MKKKVTVNAKSVEEAVAIGAAQLGADIVQPCLVVALPEPEMSGVGGVGRFGPLQMLPFL